MIEETMRPAPPGRWRRYLLVILPVAGLVAVLGYGLRPSRDPREIPSPLVQKPAPAFTLALFDGGTLSLSDLKGKVVVLNFWASWCTGCEEEAPVLEAGWERFKEDGVVFVGVNVQDKEENARAFIKRHNKTYPNGPDPAGKIAIDYGMYGVPETFFINREGLISHKHVGPINYKVYEEELLPLL